MKKLHLFLILFSAIFMAVNLTAIPNYWDPNNIINSSKGGDPFWHFGLSREGIEQLRNYPRFRKKLLDRINSSADSFKEHAQKIINEKGQTNPDEAKSYQEAITIIEQAQKEAQDLLGFDQLGEKDVAELETIIFAPTPEDVLQFSQQTKDQLAQLHIILMGGSRFDEEVPILVAAEENYKKLSPLIKQLSQRKNLSAKERALVNRAQASLDFAYHFIPISTGFPGNGDQGFFDNLAQQRAEKMFILYPQEPQEERDKYLDARFKQLTSSITHSIGGGLIVPENAHFVMPKEAIAKKYESLKKD